MARARAGTAAALVATLCVEGSLTGMSDEQLLERFVSHKGETAELVFSALVQRHGPMVLSVCLGRFATSTTPKMPFKRRSWCSHAKLRRCEPPGG